MIESGWEQSILRELNIVLTGCPSAIVVRRELSIYFNITYYTHTHPVHATSKHHDRPSEHTVTVSGSPSVRLCYVQQMWLCLGCLLDSSSTLIVNVQTAFIAFILCSRAQLPQTPLQTPLRHSSI